MGFGWLVWVVPARVRMTNRPGLGWRHGPWGVVFGAVVVGAPGAEVPRRGGSAPGVGEGVVEVGLVGGAAAPGRDAAPVADPDPAVELGAGTPPGPVLGSGVSVGWCAGAPEVGEPLLQLAQQWRPVGVIVRVEGGEERRRDLEFDDRRRASPRPRGSGRGGRVVGGSAAGEQDVLEAAVGVGEHDAPFAVAVAQGE